MACWFRLYTRTHALSDGSRCYQLRKGNYLSEANISFISGEWLLIAIFAGYRYIFVLIQFFLGTETAVSHRSPPLKGPRVKEGDLRDGLSLPQCFISSISASYRVAVRSIEKCV